MRWPRPGRLARLGAARCRLLPALARRHWLFVLLLTAGLVLRVLTQIAYRPALLYIDSTKYLVGAYPGDDPPGYTFALRLVFAVGNLDFAAAVQHVLGLAMAVTIYLLLLRRGAPRPLSALAAAPVLLDGYQLQIEQVVMPDVMFETLIVAGAAALLWQPRPRTLMCVIAGLALGAAATARQVGEILILPALLYLFIVLPGWRRRLRQAAAVTAAFALPILVASMTNYIQLHNFSLAPYASGSIYGRMAQAADCATLKLPRYERPLCPTAEQKKLGPDGLDHGAGSPIKDFVPPPGKDVSKIVGNFVRRVATQQPLRVSAAIGKDAMKLFALDRVTFPGDTPISRWQFQTAYPLYPPYTALRDGVIYFGAFDTGTGAVKHLGTGMLFGGGAPVVVQPLAGFLRAYQLDGGYTPGPLFAFAALAGLAGSIACARRRATRAEQAATRACLLLFTAGAAVLLASDTFEFSWRYQLPALVTLPPAAVLAITAAREGWHSHHHAGPGHDRGGRTGATAQRARSAARRPLGDDTRESAGHRRD